MPDPPDRPVLDRLAALETRVATLEANLSHVEEEQPDPVEFGRLAWFMRHGRRRPW